MRLAVIAQQASAGGGTRFLRPLLLALTQRYPDLQLTVFLNSFAAQEFGAGSGVDQARIEIVPIDPALCALPGNPLNGTPVVANRPRLHELLGPLDKRQPLQRAASDLARAASRCDVAYLAWPYFLHPMQLDVPTVGTFHDFNFKHDLGTLGPEFVSLLNEQVGFWIDRCEGVVASARFIADEIAEFYPGAAGKTDVVRLSTLLAGEPGEHDPGEAIAAHGLPGEYVICPSNTSRHKNLERLLRAYKVVRAAGGPPLVLIGNGTDLLGGLNEAQSADPVACSLLETFEQTGLRLGHDVYALGYVTDQHAEALIAGARLLVAPSLYEAGSGPGLDAWGLGTPVAMSSIPPFLEHLEFLGVSASIFDPLDEASIAEIVLQTLADPAAASQGALASREAIARYTWREVAEGYMAVFESALAKPKR